METIPVSQRTAFRRSQIIWMAALLLAGEAIGIGVSFAAKPFNPEVSKAFAAGAATLFFGALLGGIVSLLIADFDRRRVQRAAQVEYIMNVLADLKAVHDRVDRGRTLIAAHQSAKTYGDEMRNLIEARVKLLQVIRALKFDERGSALVAIRPEVESMEAYLKLLVDEFQQKYKGISRKQSIYEARMKKALDQVLPDADQDPGLPRNVPWDQIAILHSARDFLKVVDDSQAADQGQSNYHLRFLAPLDAASSRLREVLTAEFEDAHYFRHE